MGSKSFSKKDVLPLYANTQAANTQLVSVYRYEKTINRSSKKPSLETGFELPRYEVGKIYIDFNFRTNYTCSRVECVISDIKMLFENVQGDYGVSYIISYIIFKLFFLYFTF